MRIIKRRIIINGTAYDIWLGLVNKSNRGRLNIHVYYYTGDPIDPLHKPQDLKGGFTQEEEAIEFGKNFMRTLLKNALDREKNLPKEQPTDFEE